MGVTSEVESLRAQLAEAHETIASLTAALQPETHLPGFPPAESRIVQCLIDAGKASKQRIYDALYWDRPDGGPDPKVIAVLLTKIRRKGVKIRNLWGWGYEMPQEERERLRGLAAA